MLEFVATNVLMVSLGVILYVAARTLPRIQEEPGSEKKGLLDRWIASEIPEKIDAALDSFLFKFLRRSKVLLLKAENFVNERLKNIKPEAAPGAAAKPAIDFKEIAEQNKNGSGLEK